MRPAIAPAALDQALDFWLGQVLAGAHIGVPGAARGFDFPYLGVWRDDFQDWFWHMKQCSCCSDFRLSTQNTESCNGHLLDRLPDRGRQQGVGRGDTRQKGPRRRTEARSLGEPG